MTVSTIINRVSAAGNGVTTAFSFPYYFLAQADLVVIEKDDTTGVETLKVITTHYTVSGAGLQAGGTVTFLTAPASGKTVTIYRDPAATQGLDLVENDSLPAESSEMAYDRLTMIAQRLKDRVDRSVTLTDGYTDVFDTRLPALIVADTALVFNSAGDGFDVGPTITDIATAQASAAAAAASAGAASASASAASSSASAAAVSATSAQNAVNSVFFRDVVYKTFADSPIAITSAERGKFIVIDASGGNVVVNLPEISILDLTSAFVLGFKKTDSGSNSVTLNRAATDTIEGSTSKVILSQNQGTFLVPDTDQSPDQWAFADFGGIADGSVTIAKLAAQVTEPSDVINYSLSATVAANALTIAIKDASGADASATSPIIIAFRNATSTSGASVVRSISAALSTVISSGSTAGHSSAVDNYLYVYALDNSGTVELAWSSNWFDEGSIQSTTAEGGAGGADLAGTLYSTTARSNVPIRFLGRMKSNQTAAGTWAAVPTEISLNPSFVFSPEVITFTDEKASGTNGGAPTTGAWTIRTLNTIYNGQNVTWASLAADVVTLSPGTYVPSGYSSHYRARGSQVRLRNTSDSIDAVLGGSGYFGAGNAGQVPNIVQQAPFTITAAKTFELQYYVIIDDAGADFGLGVAGSLGNNEVFAALSFMKIR